MKGDFSRLVRSCISRFNRLRPVLLRVSWLSRAILAFLDYHDRVGFSAIYLDSRRFVGFLCLTDVPFPLSRFPLSDL